MEACFVSSNPLIKKYLPYARTRPILPISYYIGRKFCLHHSIKVSHLSCVACSKSPQEDEAKPSSEVDWRSFRARLVAEEKAVTTQDFDTVSSKDLSMPPTTNISDNKWAHTIHEPEKGCLLIATEKLDGVHIFEKTVVLLLSIGPIGPMGLILNRPSLMSIKEMRSSTLDVSGTFSDRPLFFGGPLEDGLFLVNPKNVEDEWVGKSGVFEEIMKGFYYGTKESVGCGAEMVKRKVLEVGDFRFFDGYCAWEKEQLKDEIKSGYWTVAACSPSLIGLSGVGGVGLWEEILGLIFGSKKVW